MAEPESYVNEDVPKEVLEMLKPLIVEMDKLIEKKVRVVTMLTVEHAGETSLGVITNLNAPKALKLVDHGYDKLKTAAFRYVLKDFMKEVFGDVKDSKPEEPNG